MKPLKRWDSVTRTGFTLIELLVVIGIIGMLLSLLLPAVQQVRAAAARLSCLNRMKQIGLAVHNYHDAYGRLPPRSQRSDGGPNFGVSWLAHILPFVEQEPLWRKTEDAYRSDPEPWNNPPHIGVATVIPIYTCPADGRLSTPARGRDGIVAAMTSYLAVQGGMTGEWNGVLANRPGIRLTDITDGTSSTLMVGERPPGPQLDVGWWYTTNPDLRGPDYDLPAEAALAHGNSGCGQAIPIPGGVIFKNVYGPGRINNPCDVYHFWSLHSGGANFLFADGSARLLPYSARSILRALATRNGGEVVSLPD